jgi:hypothetical protein
MEMLATRLDEEWAGAAGGASSSGVAPTQDSFAEPPFSACEDRWEFFTRRFHDERLRHELAVLIAATAYGND